MPLVYNDVEMDMLRSVRQVFDPDGRPQSGQGCSMTLARGLRLAVPGVSACEWDRSTARRALAGGTRSSIRPVSTEQVSQILTWAGKEGIGVLPLGNGRHLGPVGGGKFVALETSLLSGVDEYEPADLTITSGTGTTFGTVDTTLREMVSGPPSTLRV